RDGSGGVAHGRGRRRSPPRPRGRRRLSRAPRRPAGRPRARAPRRAPRDALSAPSRAGSLANPPGGPHSSPRRGAPRRHGGRKADTMSLFRTKSLDRLIAEGADAEHGLKKALTAVDLIALGIGAIIGAGIFATLGSATSGATGLPAGPGVA